MLSSDGRTISVRGAGACGGGDATLSAMERPDQVTLTMIFTGPRHPRPCTADVAIETWSVQLSAALGERNLIDAATGHLEPWFGVSKLLVPSSLPPGYFAEGLPALSYRPPWDIDDAYYFACYTQSYTAGDVDHYLGIAQCAPGLVPSTTPPPSVSTEGTVLVRGQVAQIFAHHAAYLGVDWRELRWSADGEITMVATVNRSSTASTLLSVPTLVTIATSLNKQLPGH